MTYDCFMHIQIVFRETKTCYKYLESSSKRVNHPCNAISLHQDLTIMSASTKTEAAGASQASTVPQTQVTLGSKVIASKNIHQTPGLACYIDRLLFVQLPVQTGESA